MLLFIIIVVVVVLVCIKANKDANRYLREQELQVKEVENTEQEDEEEDTDDEYVYVKTDHGHEYEFTEDGAMLLPTFQYSAKELADFEKYSALCEYVHKHNGKLPSKCKTSGWFHSYMAVGVWAAFFLFTAVWPIFVAVVFPSLGKDSGFYKLSWDYIVSGGSFMAFTASVLLVFFAVIGTVSVFAWICFILADRSLEQEVRDMMNNTHLIVGISLQQYDEEAKKKREKFEEEKEREVESAKQVYNDVVLKNHEQEIKDLHKYYKKQIETMQKDFAREKKLMSFDIKELRMALRKHKALAKDLEDSEEDILNGMYD